MATVANEHVIDLIEDLPNETLPDLVRFIEFLRFKSRQDKPAAEAEAPLLAVALRRLPPEDQRRLTLLRARKEDGTLTVEQHAELLVFVDRIERDDAERAAALIELSRLRSMPVMELMSELGLEPVGDIH